MSIQPGKWATPEMAYSDQLHLQSLGIFNYVNIKGAQEEGRGVVTVEVSEEFYLYPTPILRNDPWDEKERVYGLTLVHQNFQGNGERLEISWWNGSEQGWSFLHRDPWFSLGGKVGFRLKASSEKKKIKDPRTGTSATLQIDQGLIRLKRRIKGLSWVGLEGTWEERSTNLPSYTLLPSGRDRTWTSSLIIVQDGRDYIYYPREGYYLWLLGERQSWLDTTYHLYRYRVDGRYYQPLAEGTGAIRLWGEAISRDNTASYLQVGLPNQVVRSGNPDEKKGRAALGINLEYRFTILPLFYFQFPPIPLLGSYLDRLRFSLEGFLFMDQGLIWKRLKEAPAREWAGGVGAHLQVPYIEVMSVSLGWGSGSRPLSPTIYVLGQVTF